MLALLWSLLKLNQPFTLHICSPMVVVRAEQVYVSNNGFLLNAARIACLVASG